MITGWAKRNTLVYCDSHGWVAGKFGEATSEGMCKRAKYYINYCCGLKCTDEMPVSIFDRLVGDSKDDA